MPTRKMAVGHATRRSFRNTHPSRQTRRRKRLQFESLEARRLLAIIIDPDGTSGSAAPISNVVGFDWAPTSVYMDNGNTARMNGSGAVTTQLHASLASFQQAGSQSTPPPTGEFTMVMSFRQNVLSAQSNTTSLIVDTTGPSFFEMYFDATADADPAAGTGYNDGTLILSGLVLSGTSLFVNDTTAVTLDQSGINDYPAVETLSLLNGNVSVAVNETQTNLDFFNKRLSQIDVTQTLQLPFATINPSAAFVTTQGGAPTTLNSQGQVRIATNGSPAAGQGVGQVNLGATGEGGPDAIFFGDGNSAILQAVGTISGRKFEDLNGDGEHQGTDPALAGFEIRAYADLNANQQLDQAEVVAGIVASSSTDASGTYSLTLDPGNYIIVEVQQAGFLQTTPTTNVLATGLTGAGDVADNGFALTLPSEGALTGNDFGNARTGTITGQKFNDLNGNGSEDTGEPGIANFEIRAYADTDGNGTLSQTEFDAGTAATATTDANGNYTFTLNPGNYILVEVLPSNSTQTAPTTNVLESLNTGAITLATGGYAISVTSNATLTNNDFGNAQEATITGRKFDDLEGDGSTTGDPGLANWEIRAYVDTDANGMLSQAEFNTTPAAVTTTAPGGNYALTVQPGSYILLEVLQGDYTQTLPNNSLIEGGFDTGLVASGGYAVTVTAGQSISDQDFANTAHATITGQKYHDLNGNGNQDPGEPGLADWEIRAYVDTDGNGTLDTSEATAGPAGTAMTTSSGSYTLTLGAANYILVEVLPNEWQQTVPANTVAPNLLPLGARGYALTLSSGETAQANDFGNVLPGSIHGHKFYDEDADGQQGPTEDRLTGFEIILTDTNDQPVNDIFGNPVASVVTANTDMNGDNQIDPLTEAGMYWFSNLAPGEYRIREVERVGWIQTSTVTQDITLVSGQEYVAVSGQAFLPTDTNKEEVVRSDLAIGNILPASIHGHKFFDANRNGVEDSGEQRLNGWEITLTNVSGQPVNDIFGQPVGSVTTMDIDLDNNGVIDPATERGLYFFDNLLPDLTYRVREVLQDAFVQTTDNPADITPNAGEEYVAVAGQAALPVGSAREEVITPSLAFGNASEPGSIHGHKFNDENGNQTQDAGEERLNGWTIYLDLNDNSVLDFGEPTSVTMSMDLNGDGDTVDPNESGLYWFNDLDPGTYIVREVLQSGFERTTPDGVPVVISGNQVHVADRSEAMLPDPQDPRIVVNEALAIGNRPERGSIHGHKFNDLDRDGEEDSGEPRLNGWTIYLDTNNNGVLDENEPFTVTADMDLNNNGTIEPNESGLYWFEDLPPGTYNVREVLQFGWLATTTQPVQIDIVANQRHVASPEEAKVDDPANDPRVVVNKNLAFGNRVELGSIHGHKFLDENNNQLEDAGEPRLNGWVIYLDLNNNGQHDEGEPTQITQSFDLNNDGEIEDNERGLYWFNDLDNGMYFVREIVTTGFEQTTSNVVMVTISGNQKHVALREQAMVDDPDTDPRVIENPWLAIGNRNQPGAIHGHKFFDENRDGVEDPGETRLNGWGIYLDLNNNGVHDDGEPFSVTQSMDLDEDGSIGNDEIGLYWFEDLQPGTYYVREQVQAGMIQTTQAPAVVVITANQIHVAALNEAKVSDPATDPRVVVDKYLAIGNTIELGEIHGHKFLDSNRNGKEDPGEERLNGWAIYLDINDNEVLDPNEPFEVTQSMDLNNNGTIEANEIGLYWFTDLQPGAYTVREVVQTGYEQTTLSPTIMLIGNQRYVADLAEASLPDAANDPRVSVNEWLAIGNARQLGAIHGHKFRDFNGDGQEQATEPRLNGWTFYLDLNNNETIDLGEPVSVTSSMDLNDNGTIEPNEIGLYWFEDLDPGTYIVREVLQENFRSTTDMPVSIVVTGHQIHVAAPEQSKLPDPLNDPTVIINGHLGVGNSDKFGEIHGHKVDDDDETRLDGWVIFLDQNNNGTLDPGELSTVTTSIDLNENGTIEPEERGRFWFKNLEAGTYYVRELAKTGFIQSSTSPAPLSVTGSEIYVATLGEGMLVEGDTRIETVVPELEFRNKLLPGAIHGHKFHDLDGDGNEDVGEPRMDGWVIYLDANNNGMLDSGEVSTSTSSMDVNGNGSIEENERGLYWFTDLEPGIYIVREVLQPNYVQRTPNPPTLVITTNEIYVGGPGQAMLLQDDPRVVTQVDELGFGNQLDPASIHGFKFFDANANGLYEQGTDFPQAGVTFNVTGIDALGREVNQSTVTDENGFFAFEGLTAGMFTVTEVIPPGAMPTTSPVSRTYALQAFEEVVAFPGQANLPPGDVRFEVVLDNPDSNQNSFGRDWLFWGNRGGSITWNKVDKLGNPLGGTEFTLTLIQAFNVLTDQLEDIAETSVTIRDNDTQRTTFSIPDDDLNLGSFLASNLTLGRYRLEETNPVPGYDRDLFVETIDVLPTNPNVASTHNWMNTWAMRAFVGSTAQDRLNMEEELDLPPLPQVVNPFVVSPPSAPSGDGIQNLQSTHATPPGITTQSTGAITGSAALSGSGATTNSGPNVMTATAPVAPGSFSSFNSTGSPPTGSSTTSPTTVNTTQASVPIWSVVQSASTPTGTASTDTSTPATTGLEGEANAVNATDQVMGQFCYPHESNAADEVTTAPSAEPNHARAALANLDLTVWEVCREDDLARPLTDVIGHATSTGSTPASNAAAPTTSPQTRLAENRSLHQSQPRSLRSLLGSRLSHSTTTDPLDSVIESLASEQHQRILDNDLS